jgi:hypothetical protein
MCASGQLDVFAGRIRDLAESEAAMEVHYVPRGRTSPSSRRHNRPSIAMIERRDNEYEEKRKLSRCVPAAGGPASRAR